MNRETVKKDVLKLSKTYNDILITLPTGWGKSKLALDLIKKHIKVGTGNILIVVPRNVLKDTWKQEFIKWKMEKYLNLSSITFTTYVSLPKHVGTYDLVIYDEAHHLSDRCLNALSNFSIHRNILLSATIKPKMLNDFMTIFKNLYYYKVKMRDAVENEILPDPKIYLYPLDLDTKKEDQVIIKHPKATQSIECTFKDRWKYIKDKNLQVRIKCTAYQYNFDMENEITFYKNKYMNTRLEVFKSKWLQLAGQRLKYLANLKNDIILDIQNKFVNERVLTFCNSIEQTEILGKNCINSKNKDSETILDKFNKGKVNHITSCNMINEGVNLSSCRIGIYANLNSSEIIIKQRLGRILRHKDPIIIIPYYVETREEELVKKMLEDYNPELITIIKNIDEINYEN